MPAAEGSDLSCQPAPVIASRTCGVAIQGCKDGACSLWIATPKPARNDSTLVTGQNFWRLASKPRMSFLRNRKL